MILVNTDYVSGKNLETLGLVKGSTIQSKNIGKDILQGLKTIIGGELKGYTEMMNEARALATKRMAQEAEGARARKSRPATRKLRQEMREQYDGDLAPESEVALHAPHIVQKRHAGEERLVDARLPSCQFQRRIRRMNGVALIHDVHRVEKRPLLLTEEVADKGMVALAQMRRKPIKKLQDPLFHEI